MNAFTELGAQAKKRREDAILQVRRDYEEAMSRVAELENQLLDRGKPKFKRISDAVSQAIPTDKPFTVQDILEALEAIDPKRVAVANNLQHLRQRGVIYRVHKPKFGMAAIYAMKGVQAPAPKLGDASLGEVIQAVLTRPMNATELTVAVIEAGYETSMARTTLRNTVGRMLRKGQFVKGAGGKWNALS